MPDAHDHPIAPQAPSVGARLLGLQSVVLAAAGIAVLTGFAVGSGALRVGVGLLFLALGAISAGLGVSLSEGQPQSAGAALVFDGFVVVLVLLWLAPVPALIALGIALAVALALTSRADGRLELRHRVDPDCARGTRP